MSAFNSDFYRSHPYGFSHWGTDQDCKRARLIGLKKGLYIGQTPQRGLDMVLDGDGHGILVGGAGCGKTASLGMYSAFYPYSMLVLDPKGEIYAVTAEYHRQQGKAVFRLNPSDVLGLGSDRVDVLAHLDRNSPTLTADIQTTIEALVPVSGYKGDDFFEVIARRRPAALLKHLMKTGRNVSLMDLKTLIDWMRGNWDSFLAYARDHLLCAEDSEVRTTAREIIEEREQAPKQFKGFIGTLAKCFSWLEDAALQRCVSKGDFSLAVLSERPAVVFLIVEPQHLSLFQPFLRLAIASAVIFKQRRPQADPILYLLDEMAALGTFEMCERLYSLGRGSGNRVFGIVQSIGQLREIYGPAGPQIFLASAQARLFKGVRDLETAEVISRMLGSQTLEIVNPRYQAQARHAQQEAINRLVFGGGDPLQVGQELGHWRQEMHHREKMQRPLLTPAEVLSLPDDRMIAFISGRECPPLLCRTTPYFKRRDVRRALKPNPYYR